MSKAYNSVYIPLVKKALEYINIPKTISNLITNIFLTCQNKIIITFDNTNLYNIQDGID